MSKSFGKFLLFTAVAGAAAYGAYAYYNKKEKVVSPISGDDIDDDFDDFSEDLDEDLTGSKDRSYVSLNLDKAEAIATEALHKAKEAINDSGALQKAKEAISDSGALQKAKEVITDSVHQVKETMKSVAESQSSHTSFTDLSETLKDEAGEVVSDVADEAQDVADKAQEAAGDVADTAQEVVSDTADKAQEVKEQVEEFFDDDSAL